MPSPELKPECAFSHPVREFGVGWYCRESPGFITSVEWRCASAAVRAARHLLEILPGGEFQAVGVFGPRQAELAQEEPQRRSRRIDHMEEGLDGGAGIADVLLLQAVAGQEVGVHL